MNRRAPAIEFDLSRIGADQAFLVFRLKFMRVLSQCLEVRYTVVARSGSEHIMKNERAQCCVSAGASTADGHAFAVDVASGVKVTSGVNAVVHVNDAPISLQPFTIRSAISRAS